MRILIVGLSLKMHQHYKCQQVCCFLKNVTSFLFKTRADPVSIIWVDYEANSAAELTSADCTENRSVVQKQSQLEKNSDILYSL